MNKDDLISELQELFYATPVCNEGYEERCNAVQDVICMNEEDCINNKIRKLINKIKKEN